MTQHFKQNGMLLLKKASGKPGEKMADASRFRNAWWKIRCGLDFVMKGQRKNKAYPAVNALNKSLNINPLTYPCAPRHGSTEPPTPAGLRLRIWETKGAAWKGLDGKSSKASLSTKAADFSDANAVYLFYPFILSITCQWRRGYSFIPGPTLKMHEWNHIYRFTDARCRLSLMWYLCPKRGRGTFWDIWFSFRLFFKNK